MATADDRSKQNSEATAFRQSLRRERIAAREKLSPQDHARKSAAALKHLADFMGSRPVAIFAFYWPIRAEIDCRPLALNLVERGWRACLPVVTERHSAMEFREWTPHSEMVAGEYGIPTAGAGSGLVPSIMLVPVNVFDRKGYRLGYGGGYFDRTLAALVPRPYAVGVGFDLARTDSIRPHAQDHALDAVVTEKGIEYFATGATKKV